jgi:hypothetical protein
MPDVPGDPIAVSAATGSASETESAGPHEAIPSPAGSRQKPRISGLDSDAWMRSLCESQRRDDHYRSRPYERIGHQGIGAEVHGLLGYTPLLRAPPGSARFLSSTGGAALCPGTPARSAPARGGPQSSGSQSQLGHSGLGRPKTTATGTDHACLLPIQFSPGTPTS